MKRRQRWRLIRREHFHAWWYTPFMASEQKINRQLIQTSIADDPQAKAKSMFRFGLTLGHGAQNAKN
jgi:hypothetical protein